MVSNRFISCRVLCKVIYIAKIRAACIDSYVNAVCFLFVNWRERKWENAAV